MEPEFGSGTIYNALIIKILYIEKLTPVPMELIFTERERTTTQDLSKKDTCIHGAEDDSRAQEWSECNGDEWNQNEE